MSGAQGLDYNHSTLDDYANLTWPNKNGSIVHCSSLTRYQNFPRRIIHILQKIIDCQPSHFDIGVQYMLGISLTISQVG